MKVQRLGKDILYYYNMNRVGSIIGRNVDETNRNGWLLILLNIRMMI